MNRTAKRNGFTLVEILIVVGIIVLVSAIFVPVILNLTDRNQVPKGASLLESALSKAKSRAVAEKRANGIRLIAAQPGLRNTAAGLGFAWYDEIQYIEDPQDYAEHWVWGVTGNNAAVVQQPFWSIAPSTGPAAPSPGALPMGLTNVTVRPGPYNFNALVDSGNTISPVVFPREQCLFGPISIFVGMNQWNGNDPTPPLFRSQRLQFDYHSQIPRGVQPGDSIEVSGVGELFTVLAVSVQNQDVSLAPSSRVFVPIIVVDRPIPQDIIVPLNGRPNYRVIRQPRVVPALEPVRLPRDVIIDLTPSRVPLLGLGADVDNPGASIFMSGVSTGVTFRNIAGVGGISGLTDPVTAPPLIAPPYIDIMFSPSGEVLPTSQAFSFTGPNRLAGFSVGASGLIALWVHQRGDPNLWAARQITAAQGNADNQALVAINTRTGFIGSYSINLKPGPSGVDPLYNARAGKERISADTGP